ncbi:MAG TPA: alpha/beta hydrolase [Candidatus Obscuribacterales bacterium]
MIPEIVFQHGWGFSRHLWEPVLERLPEAIARQTKGNGAGSSFMRQETSGNAESHDGSYPIRLQAVDRGYYRKPRHVAPFSEGSSPRIVVTHSFGLHLVPETIWRQADAVISLGGFLSFHLDDQRAAALSRRITARMARRFREVPLRVLDEFHTNCLCHGESAPADIAAVTYRRFRNGEGDVIDEDLLAHDLKMLDQSVLNHRLLERIPFVMIVHGESDAVVPVDHAFHMRYALPQAETLILSGANHLLPVTAVDVVLDSINLALSTTAVSV